MLTAWAHNGEHSMQTSIIIQKYLLSLIRVIDKPAVSSTYAR